MAHYTRITGGMIYDPINKVNGAISDLFIEDDRIINAIPPNTPSHEIHRIDATRCIIMPGGIDIHTHIAPVQFQPFTDTPNSPQALTLPTPRLAGQRYSEIGYTSIIEAAVKPIDAERIRTELAGIPNLDTGYLIEVDTDNAAIELLDQGRDEQAITYLTQLLQSTAAYGLKLVNPGCTRTYGEPNSIDEPIPGTQITPRRIMKLASDTATRLHLPHPPHLHCHRLGLPGNIDSTCRCLDAFENHPVHLAHAQFYAYGQTTDGGYTSAAQELCHYLKLHPYVTIDTGLIVFGPAWLITNDTALHNRLCEQFQSLEHASQSHLPLQFEYRPDNPTHSLMWATGLELILSCDNLWQVSLSIDHPNGGPIGSYPSIMTWLMSKSSRDKVLDTTHPSTISRTRLQQIDRELSLEEIAIITRAAPAKALGLIHKGHLGSGADADITIYNDKTDNLQQMFSSPKHVIKAGKLIVSDGKVTAQVTGKMLTRTTDTRTD